MPSDWVPLTEACQQTGEPHQNLLRLIHRGLLKARRQGSRWFVQRESLRLVKGMLRRAAQREQVVAR